MIIMKNARPGCDSAEIGILSRHISNLVIANNATAVMRINT